MPRLTYNYVRQYASENNYYFGKEGQGYSISAFDGTHTYKSTLKDSLNFINNHVEYKNIHNLKTESIPLLVTGKEENTKLEVIEAEDKEVIHELTDTDPRDNQEQGTNLSIEKDDLIKQHNVESDNPDKANKDSTEVSTVIDLDKKDRHIDNQQRDQEHVKSINCYQDTTPSTKYVYGVGDIPLLSIDRVESGMYIFFNSFIYIVSCVKKVDFINSQASYVLTVTSLLNAVKTENILLTDNDLLPAWRTQFTTQKTEDTEATDQSTEDTKPKRKIAKKATELVNSSKHSISDRSIPSPKNQPKANNGVKGNDREKLLKMVVHGCTLEDMMVKFNWSKKTAQNHTTYIRWWGYDLVKQGNLYKLA